MKISLHWLRTYLPDAPDAEACGEALTHAGYPVEVFEKHGDDDVFDVEVTSNRPDLLSHIGVARELGALLKLQVNEPPTTPPTGAIVAGDLAPVSVADAELCPIYTARILRGVTVKPSPAWLQRHLEVVGLRPVNNVVDITNYILMEMGQPLHAFDLKHIAGPAINVRQAAMGETLVSIDGHSRTLEPWMLVIADSSKPVALAGIMGGKESEVSDTTVDLLLESAIFDPGTIRRTARKLSLRSDASYRYERGIDPTLPRRAADRACRLILELAGGKLVQGESVAEKPMPATRKLSLRFAKLKQVLGYDISRDEAVDALARLRLSPVVSGDEVKVTIPADRLDLNIEIDLVEEVARVTGYQHIPEKETIEIRLSPPDLAARSMRVVHDVVTGSGYFESITFSFVSDALAKDFIPAGATGLPKADHGTRKADAQLRPSLLPGLLEALVRNESGGNGAVRLYETGSTFWLDASGRMIEKRKIALVGGDLHSVRGVVESLLKRLDARLPVAFTAVGGPEAAGFDIAAKVTWGSQVIGTVGLVSEKVVGKVGLRHTPAGAELEIAPLVELTRHVPQLVPLPKYPAVERDVSLVVGEATTYDSIAGLIPALKLADLETTTHVTTYRGKPLEKGQKSVTLRLIFRSAEKSLKSEDVDASIKAFVDQAKTALSASLRV